MNRQSIIDKCKALLKKTVENGATEAEMMAALAKAQAFQDSYEISDADLEEAKEEGVQLMSEKGDQVLDPDKIKWRLLYSVGNFCNVQLFRGAGEGLTCIGTKSDTDWAFWLLEHLADFVHSQFVDYLCTDGLLAPRSELRSIKANFIDVACATISNRLNELLEKSEVARTSNGKALMVIKHGAIQEFMKNANIHLRKCSGSGPRNYHAGAREAGRDAGNRATFGRPVSGNGATLRIGKS